MKFSSPPGMATAVVAASRAPGAMATKVAMVGQAMGEWARVTEGGAVVGKWEEEQQEEEEEEGWEAGWG